MGPSNLSVPKLAPFGGTSIVCYPFPLTPPLTKCREFPRCVPFFEIILKLSSFGLFRHAALYSFQVVFESKAMIRLLCFCIRQPSQVKSFVTEMIVLGRSFDNILYP